MEPMYLSIQPKKTGERIRKLLLEQGYTIREIQGAFGFENPQAIYKWLSGKSLPSIDNFIILSRLLHTSIEDILVIDGDISYYIGNFISYVIKASGRMRTAVYTEDVASDPQGLSVHGEELGPQGHIQSGHPGAAPERVPLKALIVE